MNSNVQRPSASPGDTTGDVEVCELIDLHDVTALAGVFDQIWRPGLVPVELLRALASSGNYVAGAFRAGELIGGCIGFFEAPAWRTLHSHIAGVLPEVRASGAGRALKTHQRSWATQRGVTMIEWTFDPLVRRNAYFNLVKLGASIVEYLPNFYGPMRDQINGTSDSDRVLVRWDLRRESTRLHDDVVVRATPILTVGVGGWPTRHLIPDAGVVALTIPADIEQLRGSTHAAAGQWRASLRDAFLELAHPRAAYVGFDPTVGYLFALNEGSEGEA